MRRRKLLGWLPVGLAGFALMGSNGDCDLDFDDDEVEFDFDDDDDDFDFDDVFDRVVRR